MNATSPNRRRTGPGSIGLVVIVLALLAYYFWSRAAVVTSPPAPAVAPLPRPVATTPATGLGLPPGAHYEEGILLDAQGQRILNEAGLPPGPPLDPAKPIPIKAAPGDIVGYRKDANGVSQPMRASDIKTAANTPGTYAVVDMWANGGPAVVAPTQGRHLSDAEVARLRAAEAQRDAASAARR